MKKLEKSYKEKLGFLTGRWSTTDFIYPGFVGPGGKGEGTVVFEWQMSDFWLGFNLRTELPGTGSYKVRGVMGYNSQAGHYQAVNWNNRNRMYTYRGYWKEDDTLAYHLLYPKQHKKVWVYYRKISDREVHKWLEMEGRDGRTTIGYEMIFNKQTDR